MALSGVDICSLVVVDYLVGGQCRCGRSGRCYRGRDIPQCRRFHDLSCCVAACSTCLGLYTLHSRLDRV